MMIPTLVLLVVSDGQADAVETTKRSVRLAGLENDLKECRQDELDGIVMATKAEAVHIILPGVIVLPEFYRAMLHTLEASGRDFVTCKCGLFNDKSSVVKAAESGYESAQVIVRSWVYREIGVGNISPTDLTNKVLGEYRGMEVPHVLLVRI